MKKIILLFLILIAAFTSYAQHTTDFYIQFDTGDSLTKTRWNFRSFDTSFDNINNWINIDTVNYHRNQWQIGRPQKALFNAAYSYPNAIVTDSIRPLLPNDTSVFILKLPKTVNWGSLQEITFYQKLHIDTGDKVQVAFSTDGGNHWNEQYSYIDTVSDSATPLSEWDFVRLYLSSSILYGSNNTVLAQFILITGSDTMAREGWMIDNIDLGYMGEDVPIVSKNIEINYYPNPVQNELHITTADKITSVSIINLAGQTVHNHEYNTSNVQVDVSLLPKDIYFLKVNGVVVRKFVKQ